MSRVQPGTGFGLPRGVAGSSKSGTDWMMVSSLTMSFGVIVFLLCQVVLPRAVSHIEYARVAASQHDMRVLAQAVRNFRLDCDRYPYNDEGLRALLVRPINSRGWNGPYISDLPRDPWHHPYHFQSPGPSDTGFEIRSDGPDEAINGISKSDFAVDDDGR